MVQVTPKGNTKHNCYGYKMHSEVKATHLKIPPWILHAREALGLYVWCPASLLSIDADKRSPSPEM